MDWQAVSNALESAYGNPRHGNPQNPTDCLLYLMLSRKTPIATAARVFERLQQLVNTWDDLPDCTAAKIAAAIYGSGLEAIRADHIRHVAAILRERFGAVTLDPLRAWSDSECLRFLAELPGVGVKTALCVMMYTLDRQVFPADAHCIRVLKRIGMIPDHLEHRPAQRALAQLVPPELAYKLHVNLVAHGQQVCKAGRPACGACVVREHCAYGVAAQAATERAVETPAGYSTSDADCD